MWINPHSHRDPFICVHSPCRWHHTGKNTSVDLRAVFSSVCDVFSRFWALATLAWFCTVTVCQSLGLKRTSTVKKSLITNQNIYTLIFIMFLATDDIQTDDQLKENKASWQVSSWVTICPFILHVSGIIQG